MTFDEAQRAMDNDWNVIYQGKPARIIESNTMNKTFTVKQNGKHNEAKASELGRTAQ